MPITAYIFECDNETFSDCIRLNVFGSNKPWPMAVKRGDLCFLYHLGSHTLLALWEAASYGALSLVPTAFQGHYRYQARVILVSLEMIEVPRAVLNDIIRNSATGRADNVLEGYRAHNLIQFFAAKTHAEFEREMALDDLDRDYRNRWPPQYICEDGHRVRSQGEKIIDDWLSRHRVFHAVEPIFPNLHNLIPDFMVYDGDGNQVFIEDWGLEPDATYNRRTELKYQIYRDQRLKLIGIKPSDLQNVDEALRADFHRNRIPIPL